MCSARCALFVAWRVLLAARCLWIIVRCMLHVAGYSLLLLSFVLFVDCWLMIVVSLSCIGCCLVCVFFLACLFCGVLCAVVAVCCLLRAVVALDWCY